MKDSSIFYLFHKTKTLIFHPQTFSCRTIGWVGGTHRQVEIWLAPRGTILKVVGGSDVYIASDGEAILRVDDSGKVMDGPLSGLSDLDREIMLGPALVLALAMRNTWSLHASAAMFQNQTIAFLGESGRGKSTLAAYLDSSGWRRVADDILPVTYEDSGVQAWPHFPQSKLPADNQPGLNFPGLLQLNKVCLLEKAETDTVPKLQRLPPNQAVRVLLSHTAGTRLFSSDLLAKHLEFCGRAAERVPVYRLSYPHRRDALPKVKDLLESIC